MIYDQMRSELRELVQLVRLDEQYCAAVMTNQLIPDNSMSSQHVQRAARIVELSARYGLV